MHTPFKSKKYLYTIIDCPGHKEFIQKMLTGASEASAAILVVSAKEGIEPQTREHLYLIKTLGIDQLVVAVNKMDLVAYSQETFGEFSENLKEMLSPLGYNNAPIVPLSAFCGENVTQRTEKMKWYRNGTLIETIDNTVSPPQPLSRRPLRCVVQDIYPVQEEKIAVCRVETGMLKTGRPVIVMPAKQKGRIVRIESFGKEMTEAYPGDSIGVVLDGVRNIGRGNILADVEERIEQTEQFAAQLIVFSDFTLKVGDTATIRVGTAEARCKVQKILHKIDPVNLSSSEDMPKSLGRGEVGRVVFSALEPMYLEEFSSFPQLGRFVIVGGKGAVAAGIVIDKGIKQAPKA
jgi:elongation factor 1-alpha